MSRIILIRTAFIVVLFLFSGQGVYSAWTDVYDHNGYTDRGIDIVGGPDGSVFVVGEGSAGILLIKYMENGTREWAKYYPPEYYDSWWSKTLAIDDYGNLYIGGSVYYFYEEHGVENYCTDYLIIKTNPMGFIEWYDSGTPHFHGWNYGIYDISINSSGECYAAGFNSYNYDASMLAKYSPEGDLLWMDCPGYYPINVFFIKSVLDSNGLIYVLRSCIRESYYDKPVYLYKYNQSGDVVWYRDVGAIMDMWRADDLVIDSSDNIYITGVSGEDDEEDICTVKFDVEGNELWAVLYDGSVSLSDRGYALAIAEDGSIYVTGSISTSSDSSAICTIKYDNSGNEIWDVFYTDPPNTIHRGKDISVDSEGNILVMGTSFEYIRGNRDNTFFYERPWFRNQEKYWANNLCALKYDSLGNEVWSVDFETGSYPYGLCVSEDRDLYITGSIHRDVLTCRIDEDGTFVSVPEGNGGNIPTTFTLSQNFPNPVIDTTTIKFALPESCYTELDVFDIKGRKVDTIIAEEMNAGENEIVYNCSLSSGFYLYKLTSGDYSTVKKMVVK